MISKSLDNKLIIIVTLILFVLFDLIGKFSLSMSGEKYDVFVFIATIVLPIISKNILVTYISYKVGYKPAILYLLIVELYGFLLPIIPNPNQYLYSIIWLLMPIALLFKLNNYFAKTTHKTKVERILSVIAIALAVLIIISIIIAVITRHNLYYLYYTLIVLFLVIQGIEYWKYNKPMSIIEFVCSIVFLIADILLLVKRWHHEKKKIPEWCKTALNSVIEFFKKEGKVT